MTSTDERPAPRQARAVRTREVVLEAATTRFLRDGYRATSVAAIAADAGVTDAGLLYHFPTKEDLVLAVLEREDEREGDLLADLDGASSAEVVERIRGWGEVMEAAHDVTALRASLGGELLHDDSRLGEYFRRRYDRTLGQIADAVREAQARGEARPDADADLEARLLIAVMDGARLQHFSSSGERSMADLVRHAVDGMVERLAVR